MDLTEKQPKIRHIGFFSVMIISKIRGQLLFTFKEVNRSGLRKKGCKK